MSDWTIWRASSAAQHQQALEKRLVRTEAAKARQAAATQAAQPKECGCGCGQTPASKRSRFLPGHDGRLKGLLLVAARNGDEEAKERLEALGWGRFL